MHDGVKLSYSELQNFIIVFPHSHSLIIFHLWFP